MTDVVRAPPLTRGLKLAFAVGSTAESMVITGAGQFVLIFYNQVRGDRADLVGLAYAAGLIVNAVCDPLIGSWSDRTRSRLGRRHPFMIASILPVAVAFYALFNPPSGLGQVGELVWLAVSNIVLSQALTCFHTPHLALGGELSESYTERSDVMSYNTFFLWLGDSLAWVLSFRLFFRATAQHADGALNPAAYRPFSLAVVAAVVVCLSASSWLTRSRIPYLPRPRPETGGFGATGLLRDVRHALSNPSYVMLLLGSLFYSLMSAVRNGLWIYTATYFWRLGSDQISLFVIGSLVGYVFGSMVVTRLHGRFDKRWTNVAAVLVNTLVPAVPLALGYVGLLRSDTPGLLAVLIAFGAFGAVSYSLMTTTLNSVIADIADENELRYGDREEGILFSTRTFFLKIDQALGTVIAGSVLSLIAFPHKAVAGHVPTPVLMGLAVAFMASSAAGLVAAALYGGFRINRRTYAATRAALDARAARA